MAAGVVLLLLAAAAGAATVEPALAYGGASAAAGLDQPIGTSELLIVRPDGTVPPQAKSNNPSVSGDGRYVVFTSTAHGLVDDVGRTHGDPHIYVRDRGTDTTAAVDVTPEGKLGDDGLPPYDLPPSISADGRFVAFSSMASDLAPGDAPDGWDVFLRDMVAGTTTLVSRAADGSPAVGPWGSYNAAISADGGTVVFASDAPDISPPPGPPAPGWAFQIYRYDVATASTTLVSQLARGGFAQDNGSYNPSVSGDGMLVTFETYSDEIVPDGWGWDVVLFDVAAQTSMLVNAPPNGEDPDSSSFSPVISADGSTIVFLSRATNLVEDDTNNEQDAFRYDVDTGQITLLSRSPFSGDSAAGSALSPHVDADGSTVTFTSDAADIVADDDNAKWDVFVIDSGTTTLVSRTPQGEPADGHSQVSSLSGDGSVCAYVSPARDLAPGLERRRDRVYAYQVS